MTDKPKKASSAKFGVIALIIVIVIFIAIFISFNLGYSSNGSQNIQTSIQSTPSTTIDITGVNLIIDYTGVSSGYFGPSSQALGGAGTLTGGSEAVYTIVMSSSALLLSHNINDISINTPGFSIISISPSLPYSLSPGSNVSITITVQTPNVNYNGPIDFILSTN